MSDQPLLTPEAVREWVGDFEIGKGRPYVDGPAMTSCVRRGADVWASVRGTRSRPYRATAELVAGAVGQARCTCPVGTTGRCKHVAALLLAYCEDPKRFTEVEPIDDILDRRQPRELAALVRLLVQRSPELEPLLAVPLPGFVRGPVSVELFHQQAREAIRVAGLHDDAVDDEIAAGVNAILELGHQYRECREWQAADAVAEGVATALGSAGLGSARLKRLVWTLHPAMRDQVRERLELDDETGDEPIPF